MPTVSELEFSNIDETFAHVEWNLLETGIGYEEIKNYVVTYVDEEDDNIIQTTTSGMFEN